MAPPRLLPSDSILASWREEGLTLRQIQERIRETTGNTVSIGSIGAALSRAGLTNRVRYDDVIPWSPIKAEHNNHYAVAMLRALARRRAGLTLTRDQIDRLDTWLRRLDLEQAVVAYRYDSPDGFYYVHRNPGDPVDIPIRLP